MFMNLTLILTSKIAINAFISLDMSIITDVSSFIFSDFTLYSSIVS